ncbi:MAG: hypothetical protein A3B11_00500 [Candidatus Taylorbacteria bacterium RIFCSPLOWO2_01_FULL_44_26]|uniref:MCM C-terminal AAA(+) ATPase domain-containing protein n=2 Tax=Candidatus Tayloriibacteriota TaxID=1817919 RepID=A0A1G2MLB4_9BACT|nr:MAG: hypothetical protein A3D50_00410 [Candidatus Taylorbacteria bacterium RIFCSPHIGHO2_02_FULL_44_12]OHA31164.1 MAG: hypothetical protein A3B11_00500 [Candidatus Taylorbacteria bacterium RIFCSPLOWO2_01_FULL_44_26]
MSIAKSYGAQLIGLQSKIVIVEVDISNGLNAFSIVGLGDRSVEEAKDRMSAAVKNSGYASPKQKNQKVIISLAPADIRKEGSSFDLAMALSYLLATGDINFDPEGRLFLGELSLEGRVRRVSGLLLLLCQASAQGFSVAYVPNENAHEASLARGITIYAVSSLQETISILSDEKRSRSLRTGQTSSASQEPYYVDMKVVRGNENAKRGLEIAAAGAHNVLMSGPPGTGKTMLAQSFSSILPPLSYEQSVEVTGIHSAARALTEELIFHPPFRSPHHTASYPSIVGGGAIPRPGEITLAHRGVLFLDEFPEFDRAVIEALRQPLEDRMITISRARGVITFPAQCILVASMNPCPCGKGGNDQCICSPLKIESYRRKISGPILDRIDIWLEVDKIDYEKLSLRESSGEPSSAIRERVVRARKLQADRFIQHPEKILSLPDQRKYYNSEMNAEDIERHINLNDQSRNLLAVSAEKLGLSGRAFHRIIKVARTIADLANVTEISSEHILEALQYRHSPKV